MIINCKKAALLIDKSTIEVLNWKEKLALRFHLPMCKHCTNYNKDAITLNQHLEKLISSKKQETLSDKDKAVMTQKLNSQKR